MMTLGTEWERVVLYEKHIHDELHSVEEKLGRIYVQKGDSRCDKERKMVQNQ
jgi:hypothetical protein